MTLAANWMTKGACHYGLFQPSSVFSKGFKSERAKAGHDNDEQLCCNEDRESPF